MAGQRDLTVRKAAMRDIEPMPEVIGACAAKGIMLPRTEFEMSENLRDLSVVYSGDDQPDCEALHFYNPTMGEVSPRPWLLLKFQIKIIKII